MKQQSNLKKSQTVQFNTTVSFPSISRQSIVSPQGEVTTGLTKSKGNKRAVATQIAQYQLLKRQRISVLKQQVKRMKIITLFKQKIKQVFLAIVFIQIAKGQARASHLMDSQPRLHRKQRFLLYPTDPFKKVTDIILIVVLFFNIIYLPYRTAFIDENDVVFIIDLILDLIFFFDIILNFLTCYYNEDNQFIQEFQLIAKNYLSKWFIIDFFAILPFQYFHIAYIKYNKLFRLFKGQRINEIMNQATLTRNQLLEWLLDFFDLKQARLLNIILFILIGSHIFACLWYLSANIIEGDQDWTDGEKLDNHSYYINSLYWAFQTLTTVGYGDCAAKNFMEYVIAIVWILCGAAFNGLVIGSLSDQLKELDSDNSFNLILMDYDKLFRQVHILPEIKKDVYTYLNFNRNHHPCSSLLYEDWFQQLHLNTSKSITLWLTQKQIMTVHFFRLNLNFATLIYPQTIIQKVNTKEIIWMKNDQVDEIYFLIRGKVHYRTQFNQTLLEINEGGIFGEQEFFNKKSICIENCRRHYAIASEDSVYLTINSELFFEQLKAWQPLLHYLGMTAELREQQIKKTQALLQQRQLEERERAWRLEQIKSACNIDVAPSKAMKFRKTLVLETRLTRTSSMLERLISNKKNTLNILMSRFRKVVRMIIFANRTIDKQINFQSLSSSKQSLSTAIIQKQQSSKIHPVCSINFISKIKAKAKNIKKLVAFKQKLFHSKQKNNKFKTYFQSLQNDQINKMKSSIRSNFSQKSIVYNYNPLQQLTEVVDQLETYQKQIEKAKWLLRVKQEDYFETLSSINKFISKISY